MIEDRSSILGESSNRRYARRGVCLDPKRESYDFGKFGWITDPEGNRVELWEPITAE